MMEAGEVRTSTQKERGPTRARSLPRAEVGVVLVPDSAASTATGKLRLGINNELHLLLPIHAVRPHLKCSSSSCCLASRSDTATGGYGVQECPHY
jgi:hypothetical protein